MKFSIRKTKEFTWLWICIHFWSPVVNFSYWITHPWKYPGVWLEKRRIRKRVHNINDVQRELRKIKWAEDQLGDWVPWISTFLARSKRDDDDGAAVYGQWLLKTIQIDSEIVRLKGPSGSRAVCLSKTGAFMTDKHRLIRVKPPAMDFIMEYYNNKYTDIVK